MQVCVAPDKFKGSLSAVEAARSIGRGLVRGWPGLHPAEVPLADGGEGTLDVLLAAAGGERRSCRVHGPLGETVTAEFGLIEGGRTGVVEMARASGLALVPRGRRDPLGANTFGTGELIRACLDAGCSRIVVTIGGSATTDGGAGMAAALGARFLDGKGNLLPPEPRALLELERVDLQELDPRLPSVTVEVACDVQNPLTGPNGAAAVYGPQKGASATDIELLDRALARLAAVVRRDLGVDIERLPGAGAAGGLGGGLVAFAGARLLPGIELVMDAVDLPGRVKESSWVVTGEGRVDAQSVYGKVPAGVARLARRMGRPVAVLAGQIAPNAEALYEMGVDVMLPIVSGPVGREEAMAQAGALLEEAAFRLARAVRMGFLLGGRDG